MLLSVKDGNGDAAIVCVQSQETPNADASGTILAPNASQALMAANPDRAGWLFQNTSSGNMTLNDIGVDATDPSSFLIGAGQYFPPPGYPVTTGSITVAGPDAGATFVVREW